MEHDRPEYRMMIAPPLKLTFDHRSADKIEPVRYGRYCYVAAQWIWHED